VGFETDLKETLEAIADRAPDPHRLRSGLQARARVRRQRRALLAAGASAIGAAAVGVPAFVWLTSRRPAAPPAGPGLRRPLRLRPTWLPAGLVASRRSVSLEGIETENFEDATGTETGRGMVLSVSDSWDSLSITSESFTDVNGAPAWITPSRFGGVSQINWRLADGWRATVDGPDSESVLRIARSCVADGRAVCEIAMRFGALTGPFDVVVGGTPDRPYQQLFSGDVVHRTSVIAELRREPSAFSGFGEPVTVRGHAGLVSPGKTSPDGGLLPASLVVDLGDGRWLSLEDWRDGNSRDGIIALAEEMSIGPDPDLSWVGRGV
jgi:hypothetical protein